MDGVEVSKRLRKLRESYHIEHNMEKRLSTKKLAEMLNEKYKENGIKGITEQTLKDYERPGLSGTTENITKGKAVYGMRIEYLDMLADFYGVSADYLLCRTEEKTTEASEKVTMQTIGISELALKYLLPHSKDWQMETLNHLLEMYPYFLNVLSNTYTFLAEYEKTEKMTGIHDREIKEMFADDWDTMMKNVSKITIPTNVMEQQRRMLKLWRYEAGQSLIETIDKIVEAQAKKKEADKGGKH